MRTRAASTSQKVVRAAVLVTPAAELESLVAEYAQTNPAVTVGPGLGEGHDLAALPAAGLDRELEEDEAPELLGEEGESFELDPDGDFSIVEVAAPAAHRRAPDLVIEVEQKDGRVRFVAEPGPLAGVSVKKDRALRPEDLAAARWLVAAIDERARRLLEIGEIIVERQRAFFLATAPDEALRGLKPLTREELARRLGVHATTVGRLIAASEVETPNVGRVPLSLFVGPGVRGMLGVALAAWIREIMATAPRGRWSRADLRVELERRGVIDGGGSKKDKEKVEKWIARAKKDLLGLRKGLA